MINPLKYSKLIKFEIKVSNIVNSKIYFNLNDGYTDMFRNHIGKKIYFTFDSIVCNCICLYDGVNGVKSFFLTNISNITIFDNLIVNDILTIYDTFSIQNDNELATFQDIADYFISKGGKFEINNGSLSETYFNDSKAGLLIPFDKSKLDKIPLIVKSNNIEITNLTFTELAKLKVDFTESITNYKLLVKDEDNNVIDMDLTFINNTGLNSNENCLVKINSCSIAEIDQIEFQFNKINFDQSTFVQITCKLTNELTDTKDIEIYLGIISIDSINVPVETPNNINILIFDADKESFMINKFLLDIDYLNKRALITDEERASFVAVPDFPQPLFAQDIIVSLAPGKTLGRYNTGETIPAQGKTAEEVFNLISKEPIAPTLTLTSSTTIQFGQTNISNSLNFTHIIRSLNGVIATASLQYRRNNTGAWTELSNDISINSFVHTLTDTAFNSAPFNYQYIVTDSIGATSTITLNITPVAYVAPSINLSIVASVLGSIDTNVNRETGNISSILRGILTRNSPNVAITNYQFSVSINGGAFTNIGDLFSSPSQIGGTLNDFIDTTPTSSTTSAVYKLTVIDAYNSVNLGIVKPSISVTVNFKNMIFFGDSASVPSDSASVKSLTGKRFVDAGNTFTLNTGNSNKIFSVAMPATKILSEVLDLDALSASVFVDYILNTFNVNNASGNPISYNVYTMEIAIPYDDNHRHQISIA